MGAMVDDAFVVGRKQHSFLRAKPCRPSSSRAVLRPPAPLRASSPEGSVPGAQGEAPCCFGRPRRDHRSCCATDAEARLGRGTACLWRSSGEKEKGTGPKRRSVRCKLADRLLRARSQVAPSTLRARSQQLPARSEHAPSSSQHAPSTPPCTPPARSVHAPSTCSPKRLARRFGWHGPCGWHRRRRETAVAFYSFVQAIPIPRDPDAIPNAFTPPPQGLSC
jgi:hypothetical protein